MSHWYFPPRPRQQDSHVQTYRRAKRHPLGRR